MVAAGFPRREAWQSLLDSRVQVPFWFLFSHLLDLLQFSTLLPRPVPSLPGLLLPDRQWVPPPSEPGRTLQRATQLLQWAFSSGKFLLTQDLMNCLTIFNTGQVPPGMLWAMVQSVSPSLCNYLLVSSSRRQEAPWGHNIFLAHLCISKPVGGTQEVFLKCEWQQKLIHEQSSPETFQYVCMCYASEYFRNIFQI